jgi:ABC-type antimicrobial peptide transport system permease subunit
MVFKNLWRRKARSALTMGGIAIGVSVIALLVVFGQGISAQMNAFITRSGAEISVMQGGIADMSFSTIAQDAGEEIANLPGVEWVSGVSYNFVEVEGQRIFTVFGMELQTGNLQRLRLISGRMPAAQGEVLLGRLASELLEKQPGDTLRIQEHTLSICGIYDAGPGLENGGAILSLPDAQRIFKREGQVSLLQVKVRPESQDQIDAIARSIEQHFPELVAYRASEFAQHTPDIQTLQSVAGAVSMIGVLAGALGTMNTMLMSVHERTREIGTLRALGWRKRRVLGLILAEGLVLSLMGGLLGVAIGAGLAYLLGRVPELAGVVAIESISSQAVLSGLLVALGLGLLGALYPAWRAARMHPIDALRYE